MLVSPFRFRTICKGFAETGETCPHCGAPMRRLGADVAPEYGSCLQGRAVKRQSFAFCPRCGYGREEPAPLKQNKGE